MKWAKARKHGDNYYCVQDLLHVMLVTFAVCLAVACVIVLLLVIMNPRVATAGDIVNWRTARRLAAVVIRSEKVTTRYSEPIAILLCEITAYSPTVAECDASPLVTASGQKVRVGGVAADWRVLPRGSIITIDGYNGGDPCTVIDTGSLIRGKTLDVFMWSSEDARQWGRRRNVEVRVLYIPKAPK